MAELHQALLVSFRKQLINKGYKEGKCPIQTYRPDIFCQKIDSSNEIREEIIVEVEIQSTLYYEHTSIQLILMDEYIQSARRKKYRILGYLLIPKNKIVLNLANSLLTSLFPDNCRIKVLQRDI